MLSSFTLFPYSQGAVDMPLVSEIHEKQSKIEKVPKGFQGEKSRKDTASSQQMEQKQVSQKGDGTWCPEG